MADPQDRVQWSWEKKQTAAPTGAGATRFLSVWYKCCHVYGRLSRNREGTLYTGRCPRCGAPVQAKIGPGGTTRRLFTAE